MLFPIINHINDVLAVIKTKPEIIVADRGNYQVINYVVCTPTTFDSDIATECRGLIFDMNGQLLRRPYHKFFNLNEKVATQKDIVSSKLNSMYHHIMDKLDGSMISPFILEGEVRYGTKMGLTDIALEAEAYAKRHSQYDELSRFYIEHLKATPIFEWVTPSNRIVIDYKEDSLVMTGARYMRTGEYLSYNYFSTLAIANNIPAVKVYRNIYELDNILAFTDSLTEEEGVVIRFADGDMIKIKTEWYLLHHKSKDIVSKEHNIVSLILDETIDDLMSSLTEADITKVKDLQVKLEERIEKETVLLTEYINGVVLKYNSDRKQIGLSDEKDKSSVFSFLKGLSPREIVIQKLKGSAKKEATWPSL